AARMPHGSESQPARRCQSGFRRLRPSENWNAPRKQYTVTETMWMPKGRGEAEKRAFSAVTGACCARLARWAIPARTGIAESNTSRIGVSQSERRAGSWFIQGPLAEATKT